MALGGGRKVGLTRPRRAANSRQNSRTTGTAQPAMTMPRRSPTLRMARQEIVEQPVAQREKFRRFPRFDRVARPRQLGLDYFGDRRRPLRQHRDAIGEKDRLVDVMRYEHGGEALLC